MDFNDHPLWKFSLAVYGAPGVSDACLELQERRGADVNLVLFAAFVGWSGRGRLDAAALADCRAAVGPWSAGAVQALRAVRRALKGDLGAVTAADAADLRKRVAAVEIAAEQLEQEVLARRLPPIRSTAPADRTADAHANLRAYLDGLPAPVPARDAAAVATLLGAFPPPM
jgi:uncharacterized protein (TIGR02444 family)